MPFSPEIADRVRKSLAAFQEDFEEKKMFGGLSFLYKGKMTVGIVNDELAVRVIGDKMPGELENPHTRPMDFTKRPMKEFIFVEHAGFETEEQLMHWIQLGVEHAKASLKN